MKYKYTCHDIDLIVLINIFQRKDFKPISDRYPHIVNLDISEGVPISEESNDMEG